MSKLKIGLISLGCDKNRIDSEIMLSKLSNNYEITNNEEIADIIIVNTCGFIESSKQESINSILEMAKYKEGYKCKLLIATGCLTQRYSKELQNLIPEIDIMLGVNDYDNITKIIEEYFQNNQKVNICDYSDTNVNSGNRILTTNVGTAYLRIAEGCSNFCTYCIIPKIRGKYRSRKFEDIIEEAKNLSNMGISEIILVAQDTTKYGTDLYERKRLHELIEEISTIEKIKWIRILYTYPEEIYDDLIKTIALNDKVCKYIDMPIQHISNNVLKRMNRKTNKEDIIELIKKLRREVPQICIRTSIIVGFPGETEENFNELKEFIKETKFDKLGVFKFSPEEGTPAYSMKNIVEEPQKEERENELMLIQQNISRENNLLKINKIYSVLIEDRKENYYFGRNFEMSPEIDGYICIKSLKELKIGEFINVKIIKSSEYDLVGVVCDELS